MHEYILIAKRELYGDFMISWKMISESKFKDVFDFLKNKENILLLKIDDWKIMLDDLKNNNIDYEEVWHIRKFVKVPKKWAILNLKN